MKKLILILTVFLGACNYYNQPFIVVSKYTFEDGKCRIVVLDTPTDVHEQRELGLNITKDNCRYEVGQILNLEPKQ